MNYRALVISLIIILISGILFIPSLGAVHLFDWDEINFAECAREMIVTGDYFSVKINFQPFWEKPPVFIWFQAISMRLFGINEFAARFPNAICGILTLVVLFNIGRKLIDEKFGLFWVLAFAGSFLPHFYFKSGIIDPWFNLFIFLSIYYFILFSHNNISINANKYLVFSALFIGLAILTKGPVAVLVLGLCFIVFWISKRLNSVISFKQILIFVFSALFIGSLWFIMLWLTGNGNIIQEFFIYQVRLFNTQDAGHGGPFFYHWIVLLIGCFPVSIFALRSFKKNSFDSPYQKHFKLWMLILFWVVLILFSIVKTKIIHYSSLCYFPLSFLGAYVMYKIVEGEMSWKKYTSSLLLFVSSILGLAIAALPIVDIFKMKIIESNLIKDKFAVENLKASVLWSGYEWIIGVAFILGIIAMLIFVVRKRYQFAFIGTFVISLITVNLSSVIITPRIEQYSQGAAIEFYKYLQDKDCYIETIGFKSYAHLFYSNKKPQKNINSFDKDWLLNGVVDKPTFFVSKINEELNIKTNYPQLKNIYNKNGFMFWIRK